MIEKFPQLWTEVNNLSHKHQERARWRAQGNAEALSLHITYMNWPLDSGYIFAAGDNDWRRQMHHDLWECCPVHAAYGMIRLISRVPHVGMCMHGISRTLYAHVLCNILRRNSYVGPFTARFPLAEKSARAFGFGTVHVLRPLLG